MTTHDPVRAYLAGLPQPALPPGLWPRLQAARGRQYRRRRLGRLSLAAAAVLLIFAAPSLYLGLAPPPPPPVTAHSQTPIPSLDGEALAELRAIDRALQDAYVAGAGDGEVQVLWQAREQIVARQGAAPAPDPIHL